MYRLKNTIILIKYHIKKSKFVSIMTCWLTLGKKYVFLNHPETEYILTQY